MNWSGMIIMQILLNHLTNIGEICIDLVLSSNARSNITGSNDIV
jgi:hypothetical protein